MAHPEWALKHKVKNTELRKFGKSYHLYSITSKWDPEKKRTKKVTLKQLGTITEEHGFIPTGMKRRGRIPAGQSPWKTPPTEEQSTNETALENSFLDEFSQITDQRSTRNLLYSVSEIFFVTLCAVICGAEGWQDIEDYGKAKIDYLREYLPYENGIPSDDTFRRFFRSLDIKEFEGLFREWVAKIEKKSIQKVIAIDGKSSRHSFDDGQKMLHTLSAFSTEERVVLGQEKVSEKSNEITAIPKMLEWLDVKGHIVTIDAMGCQHAIAEQIIKKEGDYIFSLKGNQGSLSDDVEVYLKEGKSSKEKPHTEYNKEHGRLETRECWVSHEVDWLIKRHPHWNSIQSIIRIRSTREIKEKISIEDRYYISSLKEAPEKMIQHIRAHWAIENSLHWILDMSFFDDQSRIRKENAPYVMAILRHVALNLLQLAKTERQSIKRLRKMCGWSESILDLVISKKSS